LLTDFDRIAHLNDVGGDVYFLSIDLDVAVSNELASLCTAGCEAHAVDHVVEAAFQVTQQVFARDALLFRSFFKQVAKLALEYAEVAAGALLFAKLHAVADQLGLLVFAMLARGEVSLFDRALLGVAALAL